MVKKTNLKMNCFPFGDQCNGKKKPKNIKYSREITFLLQIIIVFFFFVVYSDTFDSILPSKSHHLRKKEEFLKLPISKVIVDERDNLIKKQRILTCFFFMTLFKGIEQQKEKANNK